MLSLFLLISTVLASNNLSSFLENTKPDNVVIEYNEKAVPVNGSLITFITGVGHSPFNVQMTTIRKENSQIKVVQTLYTSSFKKEIRSFEKFYYDVKEGVMPPKLFKELLSQLSKIHEMKTFKAYEIYADFPYNFKGEPASVGLRKGGTYAFSSSNYARLVNVWGDNDQGFLYSFSGYESSESKENALKVNSMADVLNKTLSTLKLTPVKEILPEHKEFFQHQMALVTAKHKKEKEWWWVNDRVTALKRALDGTPEDETLKK